MSGKEAADEKGAGSRFSFPSMEEEILAFWVKNKIFEKSVAARRAQGKKSKNKKFVFFEGPPTANNVPHMGHFETRVFKDVALRYKTMRGYFAPRRAGWDTHGLPVEVEVEKALGLRSKKEIEAYGIARFNKMCRESVWKYKGLWERMTERMGFWIDIENPYITYENSYIESLWAVIKEFASKNLLYEDYKVLPWCARCGTALSSHELAQGYEKIKENSIYVKFKLKNGENEFFLVWTTTPWTLPGNVALAVNPDVNYVFAKNGSETIILAEARAGIVGEGYEIIKKAKGSDLEGIEYEPLYPNSAPYIVVTGGFVSTEDGSGIVHIAPAFGDDDFSLSKKFRLPVLETAGQDGLMRSPGRSWDGGWFKKADPLIIDDLKSRGLLFREEPYEHDYPFCWRCKNPLLYLARKSWWVDVNKIRGDLLKNNGAVKWHPDHIKDGRFGEWLKEKKNWAFSRERYWGTPLPVWRCGKCEKWEAAGSLEDLIKKGKKSGNKYIVMRHGEALSNIKNIANCSLGKNHYPLTQKGKKQAEAAALRMKKNNFLPDIIFSSPFLRTKETAEIASKTFGLDSSSVKIDPRLREINTGIFCEKDAGKYHDFFESDLEKFTKPPQDGETLNDLKRRVFAAISEMENRYKSKKILIVTHEYSAWMLWAALSGISADEAILEHKKRKREFLRTADFMELEFKNIPRDENLELDMHKPYIDEVFLRCLCGGEMKRVSEVCDVWFDSGAMPFAQAHWPFEKEFAYPADYIVEAIDQTRGWFYTLLAVAALLGKGAPYKNVMVLGHALDKNGKKMSKSLGNVVDPMALIDKHGADASRWYFLTINQPWDSKLFSEDEVKDASRRFFMILWNILQFWKMYGLKISGRAPKPQEAINKWALARFSETLQDVSQKLDSYDIVGAAREIENFVVEDISRWYIRRIRNLMRGGSPRLKETSDVLAHLLDGISKMLAPFAPFTAEKIRFELGGKRSVHLEDWPSFKKTPRGKQMIESMREVRRIVAAALEARQKLGIKVRQPLNSLTIGEKEKKLGKEFLELIKDEINVKEIRYSELPESILIALDTEITPELKEEGILRDLIREVQASRKVGGLMPKNKASAEIALPREISEVAKKYEKEIMRETNLKSVKFSEGAEIKISVKK